LKEEPTKRAFKEHGIEAGLTGLRASESRVRMWNLHGRGQYYYTKTYQAWRYHPIAFWSEKEVKSYLEENQVPLNRLYEKHERSGCWCCTGFLGWQRSLARSHPKLYKFLMERMGEQRLLDHYYNTRVAPCDGRS